MKIIKILCSYCSICQSIFTDTREKKWRDRGRERKRKETKTKTETERERWRVWIFPWLVWPKCFPVNSSLELMSCLRVLPASIVLFRNPSWKFVYILVLFELPTHFKSAVSNSTPFQKSFESLLLSSFTITDLQYLASSN